MYHEFLFQCSSIPTIFEIVLATATAAVAAAATDTAVILCQFHGVVFHVLSLIKRDAIEIN